MGHIQQNILNKHVFVDNAQTLNANYTDTGLFGIKISGSASHVLFHRYRLKKSLTLLLDNSLLSVMLQLLMWNLQNSPLREKSIEATVQ